MSVRVWVSPAQQNADFYYAKAETYCAGGFANFFPSKLDGTPASTWVITIGRAADWTAAGADAQLDDLFAGDLPGTINSRDDLLAFLRGRTIADVPLARRNAITAVLDKYAVPRSDFVGTTPLWKVFQRVASTLFEKDDNFGGGFGF